MTTNLPGVTERKGSLLMRSGHMNYSRAILNSNCTGLKWHQAREAEPKDYDISNDSVRDLCKATYERIGDFTDGKLPPTTYQAMGAQCQLKDDFTEKDAKQHMINGQTAMVVDLDRDTGSAKYGFGAVLPRHNPEHDKMHLETTHGADYKSPYPYQTNQKLIECPDESASYKRCHSQFTDAADYRRPGHNTWQDESGVYANSHFKAQTHVYTRTDPITLVRE